MGRLEAVNRQSLPLTVFLSFAHKDPVNYAIPSGIGRVPRRLQNVLMRGKYYVWSNAGRFAYSPFAYPVSIDWGSTTERVIGHAACAVLVVKAKQT